MKRRSKKCGLRTADKVVIRDLYGHPCMIEKHERRESVIFWCVMLVVIPAVMGVLYAMAMGFELSGGWK